MSVLGATGWTFLVTAGLLLLWSIVIAARPARAEDETTGFMCQALAYLLGLFGILRLHGPDISIREFVGMRRTSWWFLPIGLALGVVASVGADIAYTAITHRFPVDDGPALVDIFRATRAGGRVLIAVEIAVAGPLIEELIFRGALFRPLRRTVAPLVTVVVTAVLFTLTHLFWQKFGPILVVGVCLGLVRTWSGSLFASWALHAAFNAAGVISAFVELQRGAALEVPEANKIPAAVVCVVVAVGLMALARLVGTRSSLAADARTKDE